MRIERDRFKATVSHSVVRAITPDIVRKCRRLKSRSCSPAESRADVSNIYVNRLMSLQRRRQAMQPEDREAYISA